MVLVLLASCRFPVCINDVRLTCLLISEVDSRFACSPVDQFMTLLRVRLFFSVKKGLIVTFVSTLGEERRGRWKPGAFIYPLPLAAFVVVVHTCHKLWTEICEINQIFKGDLITFREIVTKIPLDPPSNITKKLLF